MRGIEPVRPSDAPSTRWLTMVMVLVPALAVVVFVALFLDPLTLTADPLSRKALYGLQRLGYKLYLRPMSEHTLGMLFVLAGVAYAPNFYGLLMESSEKVKKKKSAKRSAFKSEHLRFLSLVVVPVGSFIVGYGSFLAMEHFGYLDDEGARYWTYACLCSWVPAVFTLVFCWFALNKQPRTVSDLTQSPDAYDLEDLSGAARVDQLEGLLIKAEKWPAQGHSALKGRICLGSFYEDGKKTGYFVAPEIGRLNQTLVVAPPGSGKTYSIALPWSRELPLQGQSVFAVDVKGNMYRKLKAEMKRARVGLYYFDPTNHEESLHWNPYHELDESNYVAFTRARDQLAEAIFGEVSRGENAYFDLRDIRIIRASIEAIWRLNRARATLSIVNTILRTKEDLVDTLDELKVRAKGFRERGQLDLEQRFLDVRADLLFVVDSERFSFSDQIQGVRNKLEIFGHPALSQLLDESYYEVRVGHGESATVERRAFKLDDLLTQPACFICSVPLALGLMGSTMASIWVRMLQQAMTRRFNTALDGRRLFIILDEFSKLHMGLQQTDDFISTSREAGAVSVIFLQDVSQIRSEVRQSLLSNCRDKYILRGAGAETALWCSKALGDRRRLQASMSQNTSENTRSLTSFGRTTGASSSITEQWVPVLRPREIATTGGLKYGAWIVLDDYSHRPILVNLDRHQ